MDSADEACPAVDNNSRIPNSPLELRPGTTLRRIRQRKMASHVKLGLAIQSIGVTARKPCDYCNVSFSRLAFLSLIADGYIRVKRVLSIVVQLGGSLVRSVATVPLTKPTVRMGSLWSCLWILPIAVAG
jgi:hypothetical protein